MSFQSLPDIPLQVNSENSRSERRVNPSWTISHFKGRLEPITGIPASCQRLQLSLGGSQPSSLITADDEDVATLSQWPLQAQAEIYIQDTRPPAQRAAANLTDTSNVEKYTMPSSQYESLSNSVLSYKRANQLGRFDPAAPSITEQKVALSQREADERNIAIGKRCRLLPPPGGKHGEHEDDRRGTVRFLGEVEQIPGVGVWVGVALDEPVGKNDGTVGGKRLFECLPKCGVFVRPERVEIGDFEVLDELGEDMEEI